MAESAGSVGSSAPPSPSSPSSPSEAEAAAAAATMADWTAYYDETHGCWYYYNHITGESQWEPPVGATVALEPAHGHSHDNDSGRNDGPNNDDQPPSHPTASKAEAEAEAERVAEIPKLTLASRALSYHSLQEYSDVDVDVDDGEGEEGEGEDQGDDGGDRFDAQEMSSGYDRGWSYDRSHAELYSDMDEDEDGDGDGDGEERFHSFYGSPSSWPIDSATTTMTTTAAAVGAGMPAGDYRWEHLEELVGVAGRRQPLQPQSYEPYQQHLSPQRRRWLGLQSPPNPDIIDHDRDHDHDAPGEGHEERAASPRSAAETPRTNNQDYLAMARLYKVYRPYSNPQATVHCVLCQVHEANMILFPCDHRCLCTDCLEREEICEDWSMSTKAHGFCNCPLCGGVIKRILPFQGGQEEQQYWDWCYEVQPPLPKDFPNRFRHAADALRSVFVEKNPSSNANGCVLS